MRVLGMARPLGNTGLDQVLWPTVYVPHVWDSSFVTSGVVRTSGDPLSRVAAIRESVHSQDTGLPVTDVQTLSESVRRTVKVDLITTLRCK